MIFIILRKKNEKEHLFHILTAVREDLQLNIKQIFQNPEKVVFYLWDEQREKDYVLICKIHNLKYYYMLLEAGDVEIPNTPPHAKEDNSSMHKAKTVDIAIHKELSGTILFSPNHEQFTELLYTFFKHH